MWILILQLQYILYIGTLQFLPISTEVFGVQSRLYIGKKKKDSSLRINKEEQTNILWKQKWLYKTQYNNRARLIYNKYFNSKKNDH